MTTFTVSTIAMTDGKLDYITNDCFANREDALAFVKKSVLGQANIWKVDYRLLRKVDGYFRSFEIKHPELDFVKTISIQKTEVK